MIQDRRLTKLRTLRDGWQAEYNKAQTPANRAFALGRIATYNEQIDAIIWEYEEVQCTDPPST
jgi:hypothetical protein